MPKQLTFAAYPYDELSEDAKEKALEKLHDINVDFDVWHEWIYEKWTSFLEKMGFENITISWTGFWSQGDGASFTCEGFNLLTWMKYHKVCNKYRSVFGQVNGKNPPYFSGRITRYGHYYHERSTIFDLEILEYAGNPKLQNLFYTQANEITDWIKNQIIDLNRQIYQDLEKEYEYLSSREQVEDTVLANGYLFFVDGNLISHQYAMVEKMDATI